MRKTILWLLGFSSIGILAISCADWSDLCAGGICDAVTNSVDGGDLCVNTPTDSSCFDETTTLFVSMSGNDSGIGTKLNPYNRLSVALNNITSDKKRIRICDDGTYPESVSLTKEHSSVTLLGAATCNNGDWQYSSESRPKFRADTITLQVTGASSISISNMEFDATGADSAGTSIGALVAGSSITFTNVTIMAGTGGTGRDGELNLNYDSATNPRALPGNPPAGTRGGAAQTDCSCNNQVPLQSQGGKGGDSVPAATGGEPGSPPSGDGRGIGGSSGAVSCNSGGNGYDGALGGPGDDGNVPSLSADSTTVNSIFGILDNSGWTPATSASGKTGSVGQGGGGGAGGVNGGGGGGGGGCGGCGGGGGGGAQAGGASLALVSFNNIDVQLNGCTLIAKQAGNGGHGVAGQGGQPGGSGGVAMAACAGGTGGTGGNGGASAGGAGGISAGVLYSGPTNRPKADPVTMKNIKVNTTVATGGPGGNLAVNTGPRGRSETFLMWQQ